MFKTLVLSILGSILFCLLLILIPTVSGERFNLVFRADNGWEYVVEHDLNYFDCITRTAIDEHSCRKAR